MIHEYETFVSVARWGGTFYQHYGNNFRIAIRILSHWVIFVVVTVFTKTTTQRSFSAQHSVRYFAYSWKKKCTNSIAPLVCVKSSLANDDVKAIATSIEASLEWKITLFLDWISFYAWWKNSIYKNWRKRRTCKKLINNWDFLST